MQNLQVIIAVQVLGYDGKCYIFFTKGYNKAGKGQKRQKKEKKAPKNTKKDIFYHFAKGTLIHATIACINGLKYVLHCVKCTSFTKNTLFFFIFIKMICFWRLSIFFPVF